MNDTSKVEIKPVSEWCNLAVKYKQAGCASMSHFILAMAVQCIRVPPTEIPKIRRVWREYEG